MFKGALLAFTKTMEHHVSQCKEQLYCSDTPGMEGAFDGFGLAAFNPLVSVRREKNQPVHHNGRRTLFCRSLSKQLAMASLVLGKRLIF